MKKYLLAFLAAAFITACIYQTFSDISHPDVYENTAFAYEQQPDSITCGPTSAAMLLTWYGQPHTCRTVEPHTMTRWFRYDGQDIGMTPPDYIASALTRFGVPAKLRRGSYDNLQHYVAHRRPVIALVRSGDMTWHYLVVIGYDRDYVYTADPSQGGRRAIPVANFLSAWRFQTDLRGNPAGLTCPVCGGEGRYGWLGVSCDLCGGAKRIDPLKALLKEADVHPLTMIVPEQGKE